MRAAVKIMISILLAMTFIQVVIPQTISDTLKISEIQVYSPRKLKLTGLTYSKIDSTILSEKATTSLAELLSEHTPVFIKSYGRGALASASFRGTSPSHTKVTWNEIELNSPMLGMVDFSLLPMFFIDNVELYHGISSVSRTKGALGGLISLSTEPDWSEKFSGHFLQSVGSFGSVDDHLKLDLGNKHWRSGTRIFYSHSDNDYKYTNTDIIDSVDLITGKKYHPEVRNNDAMFTTYGIMQEIYFRPSEKNFFSLNMWGQNSSRSIPQLSTNESGQNNNINRDNNFILRGVLAYKHYTGNGSIKVMSGINFMDMSYILQNRLYDGSLLTEINSSSYSSAFVNRATWSFEPDETINLELNAGIDLFRVNSFEEVLKYGYRKNRIQTQVSGNLVKRWNDRLRNSLAVYSEMIGTTITPLSFNAGMEYHILGSEKLYLHGSAGANSKSPSLNDLYFQPGGNASLKPENSINSELGLHYKETINRLNVGGAMTLYSSDVKDWIIWLPTFKGYWQPENVREVKVKGIETSVDISGKGNVLGYKLRGSYAFTRSLNMQRSMNTDDDSYGKQLPFIPVHSGNFMTDINYRNWGIIYLWNYYSRRYTTTSNFGSSGRDSLYPFVMNQFGISRKIALKKYALDMNLKVYNLFNENYRSVLQRPMPGRNFSFQIKVDI